MEKYNNIKLLERFFDGTATKQEILYLLEQLKNVEFEREWMKEQWDTTAEKMNPIVQKQIFENIKEKTTQKRTFKWKQWAVIAASFLLIITTSLSGYLLYEGQNKNLIGDMKVVVQKGQKASAILPDGSCVWINSGSTLTYGSQYNQKERIIHLEGEAYFEVAKNKNAPFIVESHGFSVKALGTAFDVKAYPEDKFIYTVLIRGVVEVGDESSKMRLIPNQKVIYDSRSKNMQRSDVYNGAIYADWRYNQLTFESETFEDIASVLERNYNVKLIFESEALKKYRFSGSIGNTSLESILQIFAMTSPLSYHIKDSIIYLSVNAKMIPMYKNILN